jgi:hypothetical protein
MGSEKLQIDRLKDSESEFHEDRCLDEIGDVAMVQPDEWGEVEVEFHDNCHWGKIEAANV